MSLTKRKVSELVQDIMSGGSYNTGSKFHPGIIETVAEQVRNAMIAEAWMRERSTGGKRISGDFISSYSGVKVKDGTPFKYSDLPAKVISLPNDRGLRGVMKEQGDAEEFIVVPNGSVNIFNGLEADYVGNRNEVYLEGDRLYYPKIDIHTDTVKVRMISSINDLDLDDNIPIPASMEEEFVIRIRQNLTEQKFTPEDRTNDSSDRTITQGGGVNNE